MYIAYDYVAVAILVAKANLCAINLHLPIPAPVVQSSLSFKLVAPPKAVAYLGFGGRVDCQQYTFSFGDPPQDHCFIAKLDPFGDLSVAEQNELLSRQKSLLDTNGAYRLATNWLRLMDIDVLKLEKARKPEVRQRWCYGKGDPAPRILLPIFQVRWGDWDNPKAEVVIDGRDKALLELNEYDPKEYTRHPTGLAKDLDKLLAIPDEEFLNYSPVEKSNLVARFAVNLPPTSAPATARVQTR
jgi:hypothetical protein